MRRLVYVLFATVSLPFLILVFGLPPGPGALVLGLFAIIGIIAWRLVQKSPDGASLRYLAAYIGAWLLFTLLRSYANDVGMPDQVGFAVGVDRLLGMGMTPTELLQARYYDGRINTLLDKSMIAIHASYFTVPHALALAIWLKRTPRMANTFIRYLRMTAGVLGLGLVIYALAPTSPPWLYALDTGDIAASRVIWHSQLELTSDTQQLYGLVQDPNPVAAMPSLHTAITVLAAVIAWSINRWFGGVFAVYAGLMGFSLVYLGEHFVIDVVAGTALVGVVYALDWARWRKPVISQGQTPVSPEFRITGPVQEL